MVMSMQMGSDDYIQKPFNFEVLVAKVEATRWIHDMKMPMTTMHLLIDDLEGGEKTKLSNEWQRLDGMLNEMLYNRIYAMS